jgi:hypothetical protein
MINLKGQTTDIKLMVRKKGHMSEQGMKHWNNSVRVHIKKSPFVWRKYVSSKDWFGKFFPEGRVPVTLLESEEAIANFILDYTIVADGDVLALQGWSHGKTKTHIKFTPHLAVIKIMNVANRQVEVTDTQRLSHYWFWQDAKKKQKERRYEGY